MIRNYTLLVLLLLASYSSSFAQKYANEFLSIGIGARAQAMSTAQVASVDDVTAAYWNPAGLTQINVPFQVGAMHAEWFAGIAKYDYMAFAKPLNLEKRSAIAMSIIRLGIDNIPNTLNLIGPDGSINYDRVTSFSSADYAFLLSYGQEIDIKGKKLAVGGSTKVIRRVIGSFGNSWGFGIDLGAQYQAGKWRLALMARDITSTFNAWSFGLTDSEKEVFVSTGNEVPESSLEITRPQFILGAAHQTEIGSNFNLTSEANLYMNTDGQRNVLISSSSINIDPYVGFELGYKRFVYLRGGVGQFQEVLEDVGTDNTVWTFQPTLGIGLKIGRIHIDYAYTDVGNVAEVNYSNIFSVKLDFKGRSVRK